MLLEYPLITLKTTLFIGFLRGISVSNMGIPYLDDFLLFSTLENAHWSVVELHLFLIDGNNGNYGPSVQLLHV
jgi:hypothetical protein